MPEIRKASPSIVLIVCAIASFISSFAVSSVNVALPPLGMDLGLGGISLNWVTTAFVLGSAIFALPMGRLGDIFGRKRLFIIGLCVFFLGALLSSLAPSGTFLIVVRVFSGLGSAILSPIASTLLVATFPPRERGRVLGINVAAVYVGLSAGPFLGGVLTGVVGWRGLFLIHGVLSVLVLGMVVLLLKGEWHSAKGEKIDWLGSLMYALGLSALLVGFSALPTPNGIALLAGGLAALTGFVFWELRVHHPLLQVRIFKGNKVFTLSNLATMISYSATFSVGFFLSLYLEVVRGLPPRTAGLIMVVQPLIQAVFSPLTGKLSDRVEPRFLASAGMLLTAAGLGLLSFIQADSPLPLILGALVSLGLGFALFSSPNTNAVMGSVEHKHIGIASAILATMRVVGMAASMGLVLVLFSFNLGHEAVAAATTGPFLDSMRLAFIISAVLCFLGIFASLARGKVSRG